MAHSACALPTRGAMRHTAQGAHSVSIIHTAYSRALSCLIGLTCHNTPRVERYYVPVPLCCRARPARPCRSCPRSLSASSREVWHHALDPGITTHPHTSLSSPTLLLSLRLSLWTLRLQYRMPCAHYYDRYSTVPQNPVAVPYLLH